MDFLVRSVINYNEWYVYDYDHDYAYYSSSELFTKIEFYSILMANAAQIFSQE
jgi:hypothetical protein